MTKSVFWALLENSFRKNIRSKTLILLLIVSIIIAFALNSIIDFFDLLGPQVAAGGLDVATLKFQIFYYILIWFGAFVAALLGVDCLQSDSRAGLTQQLLVFPIHPISYIVHRILSTFLIVLISYFVCFFIGASVFSTSLDSSVFKSTLLLSFLIVSISFISTIVLATFFSTFLSKIQAFICTMILTFFISWANYSYNTGINFDKTDAASFFKIFICLLFPQLGNLNGMSSQMYVGESITYPIYTTLGHAILLNIIFIYITYRIFKKKDYLL